MARREIVESVMRGDAVSDNKQQEKKVVITSANAVKADFGKISGSLKLTPGSAKHKVVKAFCDGKNPSLGDVKAFVSRIKNLNDAQMAILEPICTRDDFTVKTILGVIQLVKKLGKERLLVLRSFMDLGNIGPGQLHQFFRTTLPTGNPAEMGKDAYNREVREKRIRPEQMDAFYNICRRVDGISPGTAVAILPKIRELQKPHALVMNTFLIKDACFGEKPIDGTNIVSLLNVWLSLPVPQSKTGFQKLIKKIALEPEERKKDLRFIALTYKNEVQKMASDESIVASIRSFFTKRPDPSPSPSPG